MNMKRKERQQKFHDSLVNILYPSPSPPPPPHPNQFDNQTLNSAREIVNSDSHRINTDELDVDEERSLSASSEEKGELGFQKLTRAQRKRLRKQKLKEAASNRRQIIGPQLPPTGDDVVVDEVQNVPDNKCLSGVRRNAAESARIKNDQNRETTSCIKVKHRRMSKKKAREPNTPPTNFSHEATDHVTQVPGSSPIS